MLFVVLFVVSVFVVLVAVLLVEVSVFGSSVCVVFVSFVLLFVWLLVSVYAGRGGSGGDFCVSVDVVSVLSVFRTYCAGLEVTGGCSVSAGRRAWKHGASS